MKNITQNTLCEKKCYIGQNGDGDRKGGKSRLFCMPAKSSIDHKEKIQKEGHQNSRILLNASENMEVNQFIKSSCTAAARTF